MLTLLACLPLAALQGAVSPTPFDRVVELEVSADDPALIEGKGPTVAIEHEVAFDGTLHIWTRSELDLYLQVEDTNEWRTLGEDEDSGGETTPYLAVEVNDGARLVVLVAAWPEASGSLTLHLLAAPETEETLAAAREVRQRLAEAAELRDAGDLAEARRLVETLLEELVATPGATHSDGIAGALSSLGFLAWEVGSLLAADASWAAAHDHRERTLPADHPDLLLAKGNLAISRRELGDLAGALALEEAVHAARERLLPADHPDLLQAKQGLAISRRELGDLAGALVLLEAVHAARERLLPADHPDLLRAKANLAVTRNMLGDLAGALALREAVHEAWERLLPADHPDLLRAKADLAVSRNMLGDLAGALALEEAVHAARERLLPADHPDILAAKQNLALSRRELGDLAGALVLFEAVHAARELFLPADHPDLLIAQANHAATRLELGDPAGANALLEAVHAACERLLPADHPNLLAAKQNLAVSRRELGDLAGALALEEAVHAARERLLPADHPDLLLAKGNLAISRRELGDLAGALALEEAVHAARERLLPADHPDLLRAKHSLAVTRNMLGDLAGALALKEAVHEAWERLLPADHPDLLAAKQSLAVTRNMLGDLAGANEVTLSLLAGQLEVASALRTAAPRVARSAARRELQRLSASGIWSRSEISKRGGTALGSAFFTVLENLRLVSTSSPEVALAVKRFPELEQRYARASKVRHELNDLGASPPESTEELEEWRVELLELSEERDRLERDLRRELAKRGVSTEPVEVEAVADGLDGDSALVSFFRYSETDAKGKAAPVDSLLAFLVTPDASVQHVRLGPVAHIYELAEQWRASLGRSLPRERRSSETGKDARGVGKESSEKPKDELATARRLRKALLDPCLAALGDDRPATLHLILDDFLHLLPIDALAGEDGKRMGETVDVRTEVSVQRLVRGAPDHDERGSLVAIGGVDFDAKSVEQPNFAVALVATPPTGESLDRKGGPGVLQPLPETVPEVKALAELYEGESDEKEAVLLTGAGATKAALHELAPRARYLHIATHGWFAPETFQSMIESAEEQAEHDLFLRAGETLRGFAPETLCGLALAGANHGANELGKVPGIMTAEELATLDLSSCELAVLSACETNVGIRRAGQGIQSLQAALYAAGARSSITSLWKVDDAATRRLFEIFYTKLWEERQSKDQALWEAKCVLREEGAPVRDWAGWVLTGDPD